MEGAFRPRQPGLRKLLGDLEAEIMALVWSYPDGHRLSVREVYERLLPARKVAYTTVMTVMGNLTKKEVLRVEKGETAYAYYAPLTRAAFTDQAVGHIISGLMSDFSDATLAHFQRTLAAQDVTDAQLARLKARIAEARLEG